MTQFDLRPLDALALMNDSQAYLRAYWRHQLTRGQPGADGDESQYLWWGWTWAWRFGWGQRL